MEIRWVKEITDNEHLVLIGRKDSSYNAFLKNKKEKDYLTACIENKQSEISLNQYNRWIFIQFIDEEEKPYHQQLEQLRKEGKKLQSLINYRKIKSVTLVDIAKEWSLVKAFAEGLALSNYQFLKYYSDPKEKIHSLESIRIQCPEGKEEQITELNHIVKAVYIARDLINEPLTYLTAEQLAEDIEKLGQKSGFNVEVFRKKKIESLRMGGLLAVNKGSIDPPTFSILTWKPETATNNEPVVLVGKGVVYDTGGLTLKPTVDHMDYMKSDMSGAAAVAGTFYTLAKNNTPVYVIGLIPATDNRLDGNAYVPGDVIKMYDGTTVEVLNTDAEGRMILADALSWAKKYHPKLVVDISTLTGAAHFAIGKYGIVGMGNADAETFEKLKRSGENVYERIAEFPFWDEYNDLLKSDVADIKNVGGKFAGAITGGKFLEHFTDYPFIHLDIAGPAFNKTRDSYRGKGASGTGVRLLYDFLKTSF